MNFIGVNDWPVAAIVALFICAALVITIAGIRLTRLADRLADETGLGEAMFGAVMLGGTTSLPGIVTSVTAAAEGYAELAVSNAIGGIAAQTTFLSLADITYKRANLEHAAASAENLTQGALLTTLLAIPLLAMAGPDFTIAATHPASWLLLAGYAFGLRLVSKAKSEHLWEPRDTDETRIDEPAEPTAKDKGLLALWSGFVMLGLVVAVCGYLVAQTGIGLVERAGISESVVGTLLTAIATSLPELVTSIAAVRQGSLTLAVGGIIGGNSFDVLFVAFADFAYRDGSIYHNITSKQTFVIALTILLTGILLLGLLRREKSGVGNIGFESFLVLLLYFGGMALIALS